MTHVPPSPFVPDYVGPHCLCGGRVIDDGPCDLCGQTAEGRSRDDALRSLGFAVEDARAPYWRALAEDMANPCPEDAP